VTPTLCGVNPEDLDLKVLSRFLYKENTNTEHSVSERMCYTSQLELIRYITDKFLQFIVFLIYCTDINVEKSIHS